MGLHYHIETDGEVYLIKDNGVLRFPRKPEECPFDIEERFRYDALVGETVVVAKPLLDAHPTTWTYKDDVPLLPHVDPVVQKSINVSLPRAVVSLAIQRPGPSGPEVLMVKAARGMTTGMWNIPGGFVDFNEHPEQALAREGKEELGVTCRPLRLLAVGSELFDKPGDAHHLFAFLYEAEIGDEPLQPNPDEIADTRWVPIAEAITLTRNPFAARAYRILQDESAETS